MRTTDLIELLQVLVRRPVEGVVMRRLIGGRMVGNRLGPDERVDLANVFDVVALVPVEPALILKAASAAADARLLTAAGSPISIEV